jgi:hypothetical protein
MPHYRVYVVGFDNRFRTAEQVECADDAEAVQKPRLMVDGFDLEVWERGRFIVAMARLLIAPPAGPSST